MDRHKTKRINMKFKQKFNRNGDVDDVENEIVVGHKRNTF